MKGLTLWADSKLMGTLLHTLHLHTGQWEDTLIFS